ncbi:hypothetical protein KKB17_01890 [bacterium]|nr:hypothetical protein [Candidatus Atribacteria bacterium]MBU4562142.1 hypothetical protein [bacterium]
MYLAELRGKLSSRVERMEDILTSNVFCFFKYSSRDIFLKKYLDKLGFNISDREAEEAEFKFWPVFEDGTEPDLVIMVGNYYLLIEAKYFSEFSEGAKKDEHQLLRELKNGKLEAKNYDKEFNLIAITADYYYKKEKFEVIPQNLRPHFKWTSWQLVSSFLDNILNSTPNIKGPERDFSLDLYNLLDKKHLRSFQNITYNGPSLEDYSSIFFNARTAKLRGDFIGFVESLSLTERLKPVGKTVFFGSGKRIFKSLSKLEKLKKVKHFVFFKEGGSNE